MASIATLAVGLGFGALAQEAPAQFTVPITYYKLPNGLKVALSRDTTAPLVVVAVYYNIGFRIEPKNRTGFAHLFEHLMFEGSKNMPKGEFDKLIEGNGGLSNGSTRFDFTNYFEVVPSHVLETMLWGEADRMRSLALNEESLKNQQGVVGNEVKVNVLNRPYGGFPWLDMPQYANKNWYNAHNFYGDLADLEAATLTDAKNFNQTFYAPNNAALALVGDFDEDQAKQWIEKYFSSIPASKLPEKPDLSEPRQEAEKRFTKTDKLAEKPALAIAYHIPERLTPEHYAMVLLDQILLQGDDSLLTQELVKKRGFTDSVDGGINLLGNAFNYSGPMLWMASLIHDASAKPDQILAAADPVIDSLREKPVTKEQIGRALVKLRAQYYKDLTQFGGLGRADLMASLALFNDNPALINSLEKDLRKVTPELIEKTAKEYLRRTNRTVLVVEAGAAGKAQGTGGAR
ncbi:MAG: insulinase family protein [Acidobacteriia bacterium]|nr:insulinase family protein [Terriglobia bacterium]